MTIEDAIALAATAHKGQKDIPGLPYILHPIRLMVRMDTELEMLVAVLHDVVEDTAVTFEDLERQGCPDTVIEVLRLLTHGPDEAYDDYITRLSQNATAMKVKLADLEDNLNVLRLSEITPRDVKRITKHTNARQRLLEIQSYAASI